MELTVSPSEAKQKVERTGVTLYPQDRKIANELANRRYEGNVALLIRNLIRAEWEREEEKAQAA